MMKHVLFTFLCSSLVSAVPDIVSSVPAEIRGAFGNGIAEGDLADAISTAIRAVAADLGSDEEEFSCSRQYDACPQGFAELPSGLCEAPNGGPKIDFRGLTPAEKSSRAAQYGCRFKCALGSHPSLLESTPEHSTNDIINIQMASLLESKSGLTGQAPALNVIYEYPMEPTHALTASYLDELHGLQERITLFTRRLKDRTAFLDGILSSSRYGKFDAATHAHAFLQEALAKPAVHGVDVEAISSDVERAMTTAISSLQQIREISQQHAAASPAELSSKINECSDRRDAVQAAYVDVNKGVNAMGGAIATLCGCMFVGGSDICAFQDISPLCVIPYQSYVGVFQSSATVWDAVKAATEACSVIGAPSVGGSFLDLSEGASRRAAGASTVVYDIVYDGQ